VAGRFLSEDPIGFGGGDDNFYSYVFNNPLNFNDSSGNTPLVVFLEPLIGPAVAAVLRELGKIAAKAGLAALASQASGDAADDGQSDESSVDLPGSGESCKNPPDNKPDLKKPGTRRNPDGTPKTPMQQEDQIKAKRNNNPESVNGVGRSEQNRKTFLKQGRNNPEVLEDF